MRVTGVLAAVSSAKGDESMSAQAVQRPTVHVPHPTLSLWQSAVHQTLLERQPKDGPSLSQKADPYAVAINNLAATRSILHARMIDPAQTATDEERLLGHALATVQAQVKGHNRALNLDAARDLIRRFSDQDVEFVTSCVENFIRYYIASKPQYRDWTQTEENLEFGVVKYVLPADARLGVIGDWGTGLADAEAMLTALIRKTRPTALIHLGDVYYSGTVEEVRNSFVGAIDRSCARAGVPRPPVFTIPGNHDYYSGGVGFYDSIEQLNAHDQRQQASYFCLRTADDWQFLGIDTGRYDHIPGLAFEPFYRAPHLDRTDVTWVRDKLSKSGDLRTIMLSHHQLFSARSPLNGPLSFRDEYFNWDLKHSFEDFFPKIALWLWGHEHSLALFRSGTLGVNKCRLLGCSAFELPAGDGYDPRFLEVAYDDPVVKLGMEQQWLNHGCAVIDMAEKVVDYFQFPSWGDSVPGDADLTHLASEKILGGRIDKRY